MQVVDLASAYGVVADGVTDNATALMQMRSDFAGAGKPHYFLHAPPGEIRYSNNRWLYGIDRFTLFGHGSTFRSIYSGTDECFQRPFNLGSMFQNNTLAYIGTVTYNPAYCIGTVEAGSLTVTCQTHADAGNFVIGDSIIIWGCDQIGSGYPVGARYFEWADIEGVNASTGIITLRIPLKNRYDAAWWDVPGSLGSGVGGGIPRISICHSPKYAAFYDLTAGKNTGGASGSLILPARVLYMENVKTEDDWFWPSEIESATYRNCDLCDDELDKIVGKLVLIDTKTKGGLVGASGIDDVEIYGGSFGQSTQIGPRSLKIKNATLRSDTVESALGTQPQQSPMRQIVLDRLNFVNGPNSTAAYHIDAAPFDNYTLATANIDGLDIILPFGSYAWNDANFQAVCRIEAGITRLFRDDGAKGGLVTALLWDQTINVGGGGFRIKGTWNQPWSSGDKVVWSHVAEFIDYGGHRNLGTSMMWSGSTARFAGNRGGRGALHTMELSIADDLSWVSTLPLLIDLYGTVESCDVTITKGYFSQTAANNTTGARLSIMNEIGTEFAKINMLSGGHRRMDAFSTNGALSGDTLTPSVLAGWKKQITIGCWNSSYAQLADVSRGAKAEGSITIKWREF